MRTTISPLQTTQPFRFRCSPRNSCFNACCRDLHQVLTPYDVLCLARYLELSTGDFLAVYTEAGVGPETGLPVVSLHFRAADDQACPFVSDSGCRVYPARPASCRTYPLARGVARQRGTGRLTEHWALIREPHCRGFDRGDPQTVERWTADQRLADHNRMNDAMLELISLKNRFRPGPLTPSEHARTHAGLYDLDAFRGELLEGADGPASVVDAGMLARAASDDEALLTVAMEWVKHAVFGVSRKDRGS